ncbi:hypothetical protein LIER_29933 [Lithospermum erythrorhizon]|uniref:Reverse transcriptase n=1 Tax=Lithospermum erythrorhizon TaxID=34254 RepID=A0AAV3RL86_LITER
MVRTDGIGRPYKELRANQLRCIAVEKNYWQQQSGIRWMQEGDRSTTYFHSVIKKKKWKKTIPETLIDAQWITDQDIVATSVVQHFQMAFTEDKREEASPDLMDCIPNLVTEQENAFLMAVLTIQEVQEVVFSMDKKSVAGPDGFNGTTLFQSFWHIIGDDVYKAVCSFMAGNAMPEGMTLTVISLIPMFGFYIHI